MLHGRLVHSNSYAGTFGPVAREDYLMRRTISLLDAVTRHPEIGERTRAIADELRQAWEEEADAVAPQPIGVRWLNTGPRWRAIWHTTKNVLGGLIGVGGIFVLYACSKGDLGGW